MVCAARARRITALRSRSNWRERRPVPESMEGGREDVEVDVEVGAGDVVLGLVTQHDARHTSAYRIIQHHPHH